MSFVSLIGSDTIAAVATARGRGGVGIVRVSGKLVPFILSQIIGFQISPRKAVLADFLDGAGTTIDQGIIIYFSAPNSFTGEDILELQGHGGSVVLDLVLARVIELGARLAEPGEFTKRAFLNNKMDLAQAEAVADLINATTSAAARGAMRSLQGEFSNKINDLSKRLVRLRVFVEVAIDFPEEEIDFLQDSAIGESIYEIEKEVKKILKTAKQGALLKDGVTAAIIGEPNVGKSSLLNALTQRESAIVTELAGTTRDLIKESINLDGLVVNFIDTAGLRESVDVVEQKGIVKAKEILCSTDLVLLVLDVTNLGEKNVDNIVDNFIKDLQISGKIIVVINKIDLKSKENTVFFSERFSCVKLCAKSGEGVDNLMDLLKKMAGFDSGEELLISRRRHVDALMLALQYIEKAQLGFTQKSGELLAEDLRLAHQALGLIVGECSADDLLGEIFSSFCIGK